jgi:DNA-binding winged helix-turn-helix (wHTH) protein
MARVWANLFVEPANLTVHISGPRRTLRDGQDRNRVIINKLGRGYSFVASVEVPEPEHAVAEARAPNIYNGSRRATGFAPVDNRDWT